jgi:hypothetical protein
LEGSEPFKQVSDSRHVGRLYML